MNRNRAAALLIRAAMNSDGAVEAVCLFRALADVAVDQGVDAARGWLAGYWYAAGVRNHAAVILARDLIGAGTNRTLARLSNGDAS